MLLPFLTCIKEDYDKNYCVCVNLHAIKIHFIMVKFLFFNLISKFIFRSNLFLEPPF